VHDGEERTKSELLPAFAQERTRLLAYWEGGFTTYDLPRSGRVVVGRGSDCEVRVDHPSVSRRHVALTIGASLVVEDLGSSNGTRIGARRLEPHRPQPLRAGDIVEMGLVTLVAQGANELPADASTASKPPAAPADADEPTMRRIQRLVRLVAKSRITVLLLGETGVGKEVTAEAIHRASPRADGCFVRINCAALPEALLEGELFGYERGAFTGASQRKPGLIEEADGGTVFLDEVGELTASTQAKVLRVLETREVQRLGALRPRVVDVRFLAATNRDLQACCAAGTFRLDLYYRLNGIAITIPPLRERKAEIPSLVARLAPGARVTADAMARLRAHDWPGNVRELRNVLERAVVLSEGGDIEVEHLQVGAEPEARLGSALPPARPEPLVAKPPPSLDLPSEIDALERRRIVDALECAAGNQTKAAKLLGISRRTLLARLDAYGLPRPRKGGGGA
jgi:two-component system response regulator AtoC